MLVDRTNHHLFQPLLYQVATSTLSPSQIGSPLRSILGADSNITILMGEVTGIDLERRCIVGNNADRQQVPLPFDYLILATGAHHSYFGHDEFAAHAPGLKSLADAAAIRNKILGAFEEAEAEDDPSKHQDLLTFVIVGAGPTGVELAGALAVLVGKTLRSEFRRINPASARILLIDRGPRVLASFSERLSAAAKAQLERLGVEVRLGSSVEQVDEMGAVVNGERITTKTVIWAAGVAASPAGKWLQAPTDHSGRVRVADDLSVPGQPNIFVVGDTASLDEDGHPLPGVAQVAMQQGRYVGKLILRRIAGQPRAASLSLFRQRQPGGGRQRLCRVAVTEGAVVWICRLAGMGGRALGVPWTIQPPRERVCAVGLDLSDWHPRLTGDHRVPPAAAPVPRAVAGPGFFAPVGSLTLLRRGGKTNKGDRRGPPCSTESDRLTTDNQAFFTTLSFAIGVAGFASRLVVPFGRSAVLTLSVGAIVRLDSTFGDILGWLSVFALASWVVCGLSKADSSFSRLACMSASCFCRF